MQSEVFKSQSTRGKSNAMSDAHLVYVALSEIQSVILAAGLLYSIGDGLPKSQRCRLKVACVRRFKHLHEVAQYSMSV